MIATVTANPCIDKTVEVEKFDLYKMNRVQILREDVSGKGINVSYALSNLGQETICLGFDFTEGVSILKETLKQKGIQYDVVNIKGKLRTCTKIFDRSLKHTIEINEYGNAVTSSEEDALLQKIVCRAKECDIITLSGSLPKGMSSDFYYNCIKKIKETAPNCKICLDAEKEVFLKALKASPYFIKPNIYEFQEAFGCEIHSIEELNAKSQEVIRLYNLALICVSLGKDGAYITDGKEAYFAESLKVEVRSIQGAGDSMVAGICMALQENVKLIDILRYGLAAASASIQLEGTQFCSREEFLNMLSREYCIKSIAVET